MNRKKAAPKGEPQDSSLDPELEFIRELEARSSQALAEFEKDHKAGVDRAVATMMWLLSGIPEASALAPPLNYLMDALAGLDVGKRSTLFKAKHIENAPGLPVSELKRRAALALCVEAYRKQGMTLNDACARVAADVGEKPAAIKKWREGILSKDNKTYHQARENRLSASDFFDEIRTRYEGDLASPDFPAKLIAAAQAFSRDPKKPPS